MITERENWPIMIKMWQRKKNDDIGVKFKLNISGLTEKIVDCGNVATTTV